MPSFDGRCYLSTKYLPLSSVAAYSINFSSIDEMLTDIAKTDSDFFSIFLAESKFYSESSAKMITILKNNLYKDILRHRDIFRKIWQKEKQFLSNYNRQDLFPLFSLWLKKFRKIFEFPPEVDIQKIFLILDKKVSLWIGEKSLIIYGYKDANISIIYNAMFAFDPRYFLRITTHEFLHLLTRKYRQQLNNVNIIRDLLSDPFLDDEKFVQILTAYAMIKWGISTLDVEKRFINAHSVDKLLTLINKNKITTEY
jgi:hypothetical protein